MILAMDFIEKLKTLIVRWKNVDCNWIWLPLHSHLFQSANRIYCNCICSCLARNLCISLNNNNNIQIDQCQCLSILYLCFLHSRYRLNKSASVEIDMRFGVVSLFQFGKAQKWKWSKPNAPIQFARKLIRWKTMCVFSINFMIWIELATCAHSNSSLPGEFAVQWNQHTINLFRHTHTHTSLRSVFIQTKQKFNLLNDKDKQ